MNKLIDAKIGAVARRQHGSITRRQLLRLGLSSTAIQHRVKAGRLIRLFAGVYAVGHMPTTALAWAAAAVLACEPRGLLGFESAVSLWGWRRDWRTPFEVIAPSKHERAGIRIHRCTTLTSGDVTTQLGIRVTTPARTVLDMAPRLKARKAIASLITTARESNYLKPEALADTLARHPRHAGTKLLLPFVIDESGPKRSELEIDYAAWGARNGLPPAHTNVVVAGYEVDAWYPTERVIIEIDGKSTHLNPEAFEVDRERDAHHLDLDIVTVRLTSERMKQTPVREAARLLRILAQRRSASEAA